MTFSETMMHFPISLMIFLSLSLSFYFRKLTRKDEASFGSHTPLLASRSNFSNSCRGELEREKKKKENWLAIFVGINWPNDVVDDCVKMISIFSNSWRNWHVVTRLLLACVYEELSNYNHHTREATIFSKKKNMAKKKKKVCGLSK